MLGTTRSARWVGLQLERGGFAGGAAGLAVCASPDADAFEEQSGHFAASVGKCAVVAPSKEHLLRGCDVVKDRFVLVSDEVGEANAPTA